MGLLKGSVVFTLAFFILTVAGMKGGRNMSATTLPYQAYIGVYSQNTLTYSCSGAVINKNFIITSSRCRSPYWGDKYRIILGSSNPTEAGDDPAYDHKGNFTFFIPHPTTAEEGSIVLIKLEIEITLSDRIQPVELPSHNNGSSNFRPDPNVCDVNYNGIASGHLSSDQSFHQLQALKMAIVPMDYCSLFFPANLLTTPLCARGVDHLNFNNPRGSLCAEIGVPLVIPTRRTEDGNIFFLIGIFDYTNDTCTRGAPNLFVKVERFIDWINETITNH